MGMKRAVLFVTDMICSACETRIARAVKAIDGVIAVRVTLKGGRVDIEYDDEKTTSEAIKAAIENSRVYSREEQERTYDDRYRNRFYSRITIYNRERIRAVQCYSCN